MKFFSRMLSSAGSKSSPTSSINSGRPRDRLSSKWFLKYLWFNEVIWELGGGYLKSIYLFLFYFLPGKISLKSALKFLLDEKPKSAVLGLSIFKK